MDLLTMNNDGNKRRRKINRTALILGAVVVLIYVVFVGQGVWNHFAS